MKGIKSSLEFLTDNGHRDLHLAEIASVVGLSPFRTMHTLLDRSEDGRA